MSYLKEKYNNEVISQMIEDLGYKNKMEVPRLEKVVINCGFGRLISGKTKEEQHKIQEAIAKDLTEICGQKAVITKARKSIASFKIRQGQEIGCKITLRRQRMYDFLERVILIVLPRSRDFNGIAVSGIDESGNLTFGIKEHIAFPEIMPEKIRFIFSFEITVVTAAKNHTEGLALFKHLGFPLKS